MRFTLYLFINEGVKTSSIMHSLIKLHAYVLFVADTHSKGFPVDLCAEQYLRAIRDFTKCGQQKALTEIHIIDKSKEKLYEVINQFKSSNVTGKISKKNITAVEIANTNTKLLLVQGNLCESTTEGIVCQISEDFQPKGKASQDVHALADECFRSDLKEQQRRSTFYVQPKNNMPGVKYVFHVPFAHCKLRDVLSFADGLVSTLSIPLLGVEEGMLMHQMFYCFVAEVLNKMA